MIKICFPAEEEIDFLTGEPFFNFDKIEVKKVVITDEKKYNRLISDLKRFKNYVLDGGNGQLFKDVDNVTQLGMHNGLLYRRTINGIEVVRYPDDEEKCEIIATYTNPKAILERLLNTDGDYSQQHYSYYCNSSRTFFYSDENTFFKLRWLIDGSEDDIRNMIEIFRRANLSNETKARTLKKELPIFGTFVTRGLDCIEFGGPIIKYNKTINIETYSINELEERIKYAEEGLKTVKSMAENDYTLEHIRLYESELKDLAACKDRTTIEENHKILTLAKKMNKVINK